jgi:FkbM family methyltransferase
MKNRLLEQSRKLVVRNIPGKHLLSQIIARVLSPRNGSVIGQIGTYKIMLDLRDTIQQQIYFGIYEIIETKLIKKLIRPGCVFFDIGANVGYYSFLASKLVGTTGRVFAFEPIPGNMSDIQRNIQANAITNIFIHPLAVGSKSGTLILYTRENPLHNSGWASKVSTPRRQNKVEVRVVSLDDFIKSKGINSVHLMKMDIEGSELDALLGGKRLFTQKDAPDIICEVNPFLLGRQNLESRAITQCLADYGYSLFQLEHLSSVRPDAPIAHLTNLYCTKNIANIESLRRL